MPAVRMLVGAFLALVAAFCPRSASAQLADRCLAVAQAPRLVQPADYRPTALEPTQARLTFVGHSPPALRMSAWGRHKDRTHAPRLDRGGAASAIRIAQSR